MCGIAGFAGRGSPENRNEAVSKMVDALRLRGPDSEGIADWETATLGHRRLAILDLSDAGNQPMLSEDRRVGVVFNGCIYNFLDLRGELEKHGHRFRSHGDTEVLLRGYMQWGIDELTKRLRGMFAFAVWDDTVKKLFLVRDRLGVKPLIYVVCQGGIAFASTIPALRAGGFGGAVSPHAVLDLLEFGYVTEERAIYEGVSKLPPATILEWSAGSMTERSYWLLPETESPRITFDEAVEETERLLVESVRLRLVSDVPIGVLLSGGVDSTLICWAMKKSGTDIKAFSVRAPNDASDESADAARTARQLDIPHEIVDMPAGDFSLSDLTQAFGEPFSAESAQAMLWVSKAVRRKARVLLTGDGGDDVFFGYPFFKNAWLAERVARRLPRFVPPVWRALRGDVPVTGGLRRLKNFMNYATGGLGEHARAHDGLPYLEARSMPGPGLAGLILPQREIAASFDSARHLLSQVFSYNRRMQFTSEFMPKVDGATMYYAIEARSPLLDHRIWEFAAKLTPQVRFHGGELKAVLREIVRRRVNPEIAVRKKQGFVVPVERWLTGRWRGMLRNLEGDTHLERDGWIRRGSLQAPIAEALSRGRVPLQIWRLLVLENWLEQNAGVPAAFAGARAWVA